MAPVSTTPATTARRLTGPIALPLELVADAPDRLDQPGPHRVAFDFLPQPPYVDRDGAGIGGVLVVPDLVHQLGTREHLATVSSQVEQQVELLIDDNTSCRPRIASMKRLLIGG